MAAVAAVTLAAALAACTGPDAATGGSDGSAPAVGATSASGTAPWGAPDANGRRRLAGVDEARLIVRTADGRELRPCVMVAADGTTRARGLMEVTDPALGGYDGMIFVFDEDTTGGFWMKNTRLPLSIAFIAADGGVVSTADMDPCPPDTTRCPTTEPAAPYRTAVEVPAGELGRLGLEPGARAELSDDRC
jgi:uncharacterized membrane protein (UPF0127 family)